MKINTKQISITALLTALAIIIPMVMPIKLIMPPFTATLASHVPIMIAMFINPLAAIFVSLGSAIGFMFSLGPIVSARAATHVFFAVAGTIMIKKKINIYYVIFFSMIIHALSDMAIVYMFFLCGINLPSSYSMNIIQTILGVGTSIHHLIDFALALTVYAALLKGSKDIFEPLIFKIK